MGFSSMHVGCVALVYLSTNTNVNKLSYSSHEYALKRSCDTHPPLTSLTYESDEENTNEHAMT
jgi:hypothetical protein